MDYVVLSEFGLKVNRLGVVVNLHSGRTMKHGKDVYGYARVYISHPEIKRKGHFVHRLIALAFIPNPENKPCINHIDGNKENFDINNLEWVTHSENTKHAYKTRLFKKLTGRKENKKRNDLIKDLYSTGKYTHRDLGEIFDVTAPAITSILNYEYKKLNNSH